MGGLLERSQGDPMGGLLERSQGHSMGSLLGRSQGHPVGDFLRRSRKPLPAPETRLKKSLPSPMDPNSKRHPTVADLGKTLAPGSTTTSRPRMTSDHGSLNPSAHFPDASSRSMNSEEELIYLGARIQRSAAHPRILERSHPH